MQSQRARYAALDQKFQALKTVEVSSADWRLLEAGAVDFNNNNFVRGLPIIVAQFRSAAEEEVMKCAVDTGGAAAAQVSIFQKVANDINALDTALFGSSVESFNDAHARLYRREQTGHIHRDGSPSGAPERLYLARVGSLPTQYIRQNEIDRLPGSDQKHIQKLISLGRDQSDEQTLVDAKRALQGLGVLKSLPLGSVGLMANAPAREALNIGTLHCSSELPTLNNVRQPQFSGFFRYSRFDAPTGTR